MMQIEIPLSSGDNYISFPATSTSTFNDILTSSGIKANILEFTKWDSIQQKELPVDINDAEYIEEGRGYYIYITSPGTIRYDGIEYSMTFDQFKSRIVQHWNLLGTGKDIIVPQAWCKVVDPITLLPVTILQPNRAYWVNYDECMKPDSTNIESILGFTVSALFLIYLLKEFNVLKIWDITILQSNIYEHKHKNNWETWQHIETVQSNIGQTYKTYQIYHTDKRNRNSSEWYIWTLTLKSLRNTITY